MITPTVHTTSCPVALNDLEGCIVDTEYPKRLAFTAVLQDMFGLELSVQEVSWTLGLRREAVVAGLTERFSDKPLLPGVVRDDSISIGEQILRERDRVVQQDFDAGIKLMPGAEALFDLFEERSSAAGIVTSTREDVARQMMRSAFVPECFDAYVFGDSPGLSRGKPHPDPYLMGAQLLRASPERCWVLGDAEADVLAGAAAGMRTIYLPDRRIAAPKPETVKAATHTVSDLFEAADILRREL